MCGFSIFSSGCKQPNLSTYARRISLRLRFRLQKYIIPVPLQRLSPYLTSSSLLLDLGVHRRHKITGVFNRAGYKFGNIVSFHEIVVVQRIFLRHDERLAELTG